MSKEKLMIDDDEVLHHFYDNRSTFVVNFNPEFVKVKVRKREVIFELRKVSE